MHSRHDFGEEYDNGTPAVNIPGVSWRKSVCSNPNGECVELAELPDGQVAVRNSRFPSGPALVYTRAEIAAFIAGVKGGEFDDLSAPRDSLDACTARPPR
ncbi:DUF397 domain-containing protein [Streptomyces sp. SID14478]|uniref:DUF397 domain-containing protein n=1 Tax=Streptomyces sp. SID14478 TaxID=2706073 RepID=UPI0013D90C64|nr:DUF397 domain-containing protein [Streptomyces sp. SID14478]NEB74655.1 DUF397 domain-containing protein [Streptomyces sp. SID14478]